MPLKFVQIYLQILHLTIWGKAMNINFNISEANSIHIKQLTNLWTNSFGDSEEYINFFMINKFPNCKTIIAEADNSIIGSLYLMPLTTYEYGIPKDGFYLYALSVEIKYRGFGVGKKLVKVACDLAKSENKFIILCPASKSLQAYYKSLGFVDNCYLNEIAVDNRADCSPLSCCALDTETFSHLRNKFFKNQIFWNYEGLKYILEENIFTGGFNLKFNIDSGIYYVIGKTHDCSVVITESNAPYEVKKIISGYLSKNFNTHDIKWLVPYESCTNCILTGMTYNLAKDNYYFNHILN